MLSLGKHKAKNNKLEGDRMQREIRYCEECQSNQEVLLSEKTAEYTFRSEKFTIAHDYLKCTKCGQAVYDEQTDSKTLKTLGDLYLKKHGISIEDIKKVRQQYGFTQLTFSKILNWGIATVKRYETGGSLPDATHLAIIKMLKNNPTTIENFYEETKFNFSDVERHSIDDAIRSVSSGVNDSPYVPLKYSYRRFERTIENGHTSFNPLKLTHMVLYFARGGVLKTTLMKLLWYSDFMNYKHTKTSISGVPYCRRSFGPVPVSPELVLGVLESERLITIDEREKENYIIVKITSRNEPDMTIFETPEWEIIRKVDDYFKLTVQSINTAKIPYRDQVWNDLEDNQIIPYSFAEALQIQE
jgi:putative zinc finger/helix-turn-helix YgiT family protein